MSNGLFLACMALIIFNVGRIAGFYESKKKILKILKDAGVTDEDSNIINKIK